MQPRRYCSLLPQVSLRITAGFLIFGNVRLLEVVASAHQQQFEDVLAAAAVVELDSASRSFAEVVQLFRFGRLKKSSRGESIHKKVISKPALLPAVIGVQVKIVNRGPTEIYVSMTAHVRARSRGNVQHSP